LYDPNAQPCGTTAASTLPGTAPASDVQIRNAKIIIGIAKTNNLGKQGAMIGLMVGLAESRLTNLANTSVPVSESNPAKEGDGSDHDSVGVFQQRPSTGWSTIATGPAADSNQDAVWQLMTPAYAAEAFFGSPPGSNAPPALSKGVQNISGWQSLPPQVVAQRVQGSGDPTGSNYLVKQADAQALLDQYYDSAQALPLPVPFSGGTGGGTGNQPGHACGGTNSGSIAGCVNPVADSRWSLARTDQGVDYTEESTIPVRAICDGIVTSTDGGGWPGGVFIMIKLTSGPYAGKCTYVAEHLTNVISVGAHVTAGQIIAQTIPGDPWTEWGWASAPQIPSTPYNGAPDGTPMPGGKAFARFLRHLGAQTRDDPGPGPEYKGNSC